MLNYIYSIIKRCNSDKNGKLESDSLRLIFAFILINLIFPFIVLYIKFQDQILYANIFTIILFSLLIAFLIVYPFIHAFYPGYKYLEKVKSYSKEKAYFILILISAPSLLYLFINK